MKSEKSVDLAFQDLYEVIPELGEGMNRRSVPGRNYLSEPNIRNKVDLPEERPVAFSEYPMFGQNFGEWVKRSIMTDVGQVHADMMPPQAPCNGCYPTQRRPLDDMDSFWLMEQAQQIAQSPAREDNCMCSQYTTDVPQCTCQFPEEQKSKVKLDASPLSKQLGYGAQSTEQDVWMNELLDIESQHERLRFQKEKLYQSLAVPDPSLEYPYYMGYHDDSSIYEQEQLSVPLTNNLPEKPSGLSSYHRVPAKITTGNVNNEGPSPPGSSAPAPGKAKTSRPRLCNFLLELLANPQQYSEVVEWVDKEKGVFKFLNSSEVASQWGRRRNKPHMKYENFARSLRTYIAKGILTKPRSKLVYRFTSKVL